MSSYNPQILTAWLRGHGIPEPTYELIFCPPRKWQFDLSWPDYKVALEVEGGVFTRGAHGSVEGILRDMEKYNAAGLLGWRVFRVTPDALFKADCALMLKTALSVKPAGQIALASVTDPPPSVGRPGAVEDDQRHQGATITPTDAAEPAPPLSHPGPARKAKRAGPVGPKAGG